MKNSLTTKWQSSQEMTRTDFEINLYSDKYFKTVEMHSHDFYEIYCFIGGAVEYIVEDGLYRLSPGDIMLIPPNYLHQPKINDESQVYSRLVLWINAKYLQKISSEKTDLATCFVKAKEKGSYLIPQGNLSERVINQLYSVIEADKSNAFGGDISAQDHIRKSLIMLGNHYLENSSVRHAEQSKTISKAMEYISSHLAEPLTLDHIASELYIGKYYFAHLFKEQTGISPHNYILKKRLVLAKELIKSGHPITEIHAKCGFNDYTHFFRAFKKEFSVTPKQFYYFSKQS